MRLSLSALAAVTGAAGVAPSAVAMASPLSVSTGANLATYSLSVDGQVWLTSGPTRLHGVELAPVGDAVQSSGTDVLGAYTDTRQDYTCSATAAAAAAADTTCFSAIVRDYTPGGLPLVVFLQNHTTARNGTASDPAIETAKEQVLSAFPSFAVAEPPSSSSWSFSHTNPAKATAAAAAAAAAPAPALGYLTYFDQMVGGMEEGTRYGKWNANATLVGGSMGGPTVLFDAAQSRALVLSPWKNFLAGSAVPRITTQHQHEDAAAPQQVLDFGLIGSIASVPAGFEFATAAYVGAGVNDAVRGFGACLLKQYGKAQGGATGGSATPWDGSNGDVSLSKLGVSTDNGAYLYVVVVLCLFL